MALLPDEIRRIVDHLDGKERISRRKDFERYSFGRGRILHRNALLYSSLVREIEKGAGKLSVNIVEDDGDELLVIIEDPHSSYRRETRVPKAIASYLANKFPDVVACQKQT